AGRHACILRLFGTRTLVVLVNKMDPVGYSEHVFATLQRELSSAIKHLEFETSEFFPVSASSGINVVHRSSATPWFHVPALLEYLETVDIARTEHSTPFRSPVQLVQRTADFR